MGKMIRLKRAWSNKKGTLHFTAGNVVGLHDKEANELVKKGWAEYAPEGTRALRYEANAPVLVSCFSDDNAEKDAVKTQNKTTSPPNVGTNK